MSYPVQQGAPNPTAPPMQQVQMQPMQMQPMQMQVVPTQAEPQPEPEPGYEQTELCDCSGSYCKGCWGEAWSLTRPFVWYSLASRIKNKNWGIAILIVAFLYFVASTIYFVQLSDAIGGALACQDALGVGK